MQKIRWISEDQEAKLVRNWYDDDDYEILATVRNTDDDVYVYTSKEFSPNGTILCARCLFDAIKEVEGLVLLDVDELLYYLNDIRKDLVEYLDD